MAEPVYGSNPDPIEVMPVVVLFQVFPARPSSIPDIRDFVRRCLAESPLTEEGNREVGETVFRALLDAAGPSGSIQVAFRIFPEHVEVDVLHSELSAGPLGGEGRPTDGTATAAGASGAISTPINGPINGTVNGSAHPVLNGSSGSGPGPAQIHAPGASFVRLGQDGQPANFADWMSVALRREGLTQEAAARLLGVSVKTVSRWVGGAAPAPRGAGGRGGPPPVCGWVGGATEPRLRDLRRIQEVFGEIPLQ